MLWSLIVFAAAQSLPEPEVLPALKLATSNVWGIPSVIHPLRPNRAALKGDLGRWFSRAQQSFDLVAVQELWCNMVRSDHEQLLVRNWGLAPLGSCADRSSPETGLAFLAGNGTQWHPVAPVLEVGFADRGRGPDSWKHKGFAEVVLGSESSHGQTAEVAVVTTHLQASNWRCAPRDAEVRQRQVRETLEALNQEKRPVVWLGDFNLDESGCSASITDARTVADIRAAGFHEAADDVAGFGGLSTHINGSRYDRVWLRGSAARQPVVAAAERFLNGGDERETRRLKKLSDHFPLELTVEWKPNRPAIP